MYFIPYRRNHAKKNHEFGNLSKSNASYQKQQQRYSNFDGKLLKSVNNDHHSLDMGKSEKRVSRRAEYIRRTKRLLPQIKLLAVLFGFSFSSWLIDKYKRKKHQDLYVRWYKRLPLRTISRAWGEINSLYLPVWFRKPCFYIYSWLFKCNLEEIDIDDITQFKNLSEFFRRSLKPDARAVDQQSCLVSPCDGKILHFGQVDQGYLEQVKGVNYSLKAFLGNQNWPKNCQLIQPIVPEKENADASTEVINSENQIAVSVHSSTQSEENAAQYEKTIFYNPGNRLYHCVIYLAPGDYHRFHSPADWTVYYRRHFPGELFSVNPRVAGWLKGLFHLNERVVYYGEWKYGFFSMTAVGATNVGSIRVHMDPDLTTNSRATNKCDTNLDKSFYEEKAYEDQRGVPIKRGELFGEFNLGSTIVLIFEAPADFEFNVNQRDKVFFGQKLGSSALSSESCSLNDFLCMETD